MARKWASVKIVTPLWVYDCEKLGYKVNEDDPKYVVNREVSTPQKDQCKFDICERQFSLIKIY